MNILQPITAEKQLLPFLSSDTQLAICHYDTSQHNVVIKAILPEQGWSIVLYDKKGMSLYSDVANPYGKTLVDLYLVPDDNRFLGISKETQIQSNSFNQILIKASEGLAVIRSLDAGYSYNNRNKEILQKANCYEEKSSR